MGFLGKGRDAIFAVELEDAQARDGVATHWLHCNGNVRFHIDMALDKLAVIHAVEVVTGQNQNVGRARFLQLNPLLAYRIGRTLIPVATAWCLFSGENLHPARRELVAIIGTPDVAMQ